MSNKNKEIEEAINSMSYYQEDEKKLIIDFLTSKNTQELRSYFNENRFTIKDTGHSYRIVNHWEQVGLIFTNRGKVSDHSETKKGWREFSMIELVWLMIIRLLRDFNYPLKYIKKIAKNINVEYEINGSYYPLLEFFIWKIMSSHIAIFLKVYTDGEAKFVTDDDYIKSCEKEEPNSHIMVSLNQALRSNFPDRFKVNPIFFTAHNHSLSNEEWELIKEIRKGNYHRFNVKLKGGVIDLFEGIEKIQDKKKVEELKKESPFQEFTSKTEDFKWVSFERTIKKKI